MKTLTAILVLLVGTTLATGPAFGWGEQQAARGVAQRNAGSQQLHAAGGLFKRAGQGVRKWFGKSIAIPGMRVAGNPATAQNLGTQARNHRLVAGASVVKATQNIGAGVANKIQGTSNVLIGNTKLGLQAMGRAFARPFVIAGAKIGAAATAAYNSKPVQTARVYGTAAGVVAGKAASGVANMGKNLSAANVAAFNARNGASVPPAYQPQLQSIGAQLQ